MKRRIVCGLGIVLALGVKLFAVEPSVNVVYNGVETKTTKIASTATNTAVLAWTNNSNYANAIGQIELFYAAADSSTVTVYIANSTYGNQNLFAITNSSAIRVRYNPTTTTWILPSDALVISNSNLSGNTNVIKVMKLGAF